MARLICWPLFCLKWLSILEDEQPGPICSLVAAAETRKADTIGRHLADRLAIRDVVETWAMARDSGDWETFRSTWHDDGYMMATWWQGPAEQFTEVSRAGWERGVNILHFLGGCRVTVAGDRAITQTKMTIMQRGAVHGVVCDVACSARAPGTQGTLP
ncbi:MAG: nuclear transport factor 2 family protein [Streptosporangiaceae bacterium]